MVDFPFCPCTAIHPYTAILHPFLILDIVNSRKNRIQTNTMSAMRVGQVSGNKNLIRLNFFKKIFDNISIYLGQISFFNCSRFIKRQIQEMNIFRFHTDIITCSTRFSLTNQRFQMANIGCIYVPVLFLFYKFSYFRMFSHKFRSIEAKIFCDSPHKHYITHHIFVSDCDISRCFISNMYIMMLIYQTF